MLYLVVGPNDCKYHSIINVIKMAIAGGVTCVQLRDKYLSSYEIAELAKIILSFLPTEIPLIINDHVAVAKELGVGLHIGQSDMQYQQARSVLGENAIIGLSIENYEQAQRFRNCGASYFGVGPVFATQSKLDAAEAMGITTLNQIVDELNPTPCVAIGGITMGNVNQFSVANLAGVAVISAITHARNPKSAAKLLWKKWREKI